MRNDISQSTLDKSLCILNANGCASRVTVAPACLPDYQTLVLDRLAHKPQQTYSGQYYRYRKQ
ncbi:MAG TPA: hypothetical protein VMW72_16775 [Sedimentisphaerales bacterium]|nr:hypothetical protein [Sedimentisphaerales bacterium]